MKLGTRLLVALLPAVAVIMAGYALWALDQRTEILGSEARSETRAYSTAVSVAFRHAFRDGQLRDLQEIIDELSGQPRVFGVLSYDSAGGVTLRTRGMDAADAVSPDRVRETVRTGRTIESERDVLGERVFSILTPIRARPDGEITAVLEVLQPLSLIEEERERTVQRFFLNTVTLVGALAILTLWLTRGLVARPLGSFIEAIREVGRGDLSQRVALTGAGHELDALGREFNRMAGALETARDALVREGEERMSLESRLREQERLAAMGTLAAGVAHQISAPLNVIEGRARLLLQRPRDPAKVAADLETIVDQADRIERIVRGLLDFAREPEPRIRPVDLSRVLRAALRRFEEDLEDAGIRASLETPAELRVLADPDLVEEVVVILLSNALDALREEGDGRIEVRADRIGSEALIEVADTGPGIAEADVPKVFGAFFTTKPGGTGLGLAIGRTIVERLGGEIGVRAGPAAVFWLRLPLVPEDDHG